MLYLFDVQFARDKVKAVLDQISQLKAADFPYDEPKAALTLLEQLYKSNLVRLQALDDQTDPAVRQQACAHANWDVAAYHHVLGFLLRATNVRNAFEAYDPLLHLCRETCGTDAKLVLSSEWSFSPFTYPAWFKDLPGLIFIGLPATEAENSLILPLAGHELGHSVWRLPVGGKPISSHLTKNFEAELVRRFELAWGEFQQAFDVKEGADQLLSNLLLRSYWTQSYKLGLRQVEELFCDQIGLKLFGEGFLYAFLYVISPHLERRSSVLKLCGDELR